MNLLQTVLIYYVIFTAIEFTVTVYQSYSPSKFRKLSNGYLLCSLSFSNFIHNRPLELNEMEYSSLMERWKKIHSVCLLHLCLGARREEG